MNNSIKGISAPLNEWTHDDLVTYMSWKIIEGITSGKPINSICYEFPAIVLDWKKERS